MKVLNMFANGGDGELLKSVNGTTIRITISKSEFLNKAKMVQL